MKRRITESTCNNIYEECRSKQKDLNEKIGRLGFAEEEYCVTSEYLIQPGNRAYDLFLSAEEEGKRQLITLTLQNLRLEGKTIEFEFVKPLDKVFAC